MSSEARSPFAMAGLARSGLQTRGAIDRVGAHQRAQAWRERLSRPAQPSDADSSALLVLDQLRLVLRWLLLFGCTAAAAACCVAPPWIIPCAALFTLGLWLIATGLHLAQHMRSAWWSCVAGLRRLCTLENLLQLIFVAGTLLALWNLSGLQEQAIVVVAGQVR